MKQLQDWITAKENVEFAEQELRKKRTVLTNAINTLGKQLLPKDAKTDEVFNVFVGDKFLVVKNVGTRSTYEIYWRK